MPESARSEIGSPALLRGLLGGALMGLANLVPGISGGTMLLAVGIYPQFIRAVADVSTLRFSTRALVLLGCVGLTAAVVIFGLAGIVKGLVYDHRWIMYSLFIGLTLGGVPLLWRLIRRIDAMVAVAAICGIAAMVVLSLLETESASGAPLGARSYALLFVAGLAGASAMILPGLSGAYLLIILGQYATILGALEEIRAGLSAGDLEQVAGAMNVVIPVGLGVCVGVVGVSNAVKYLLARFERATLGVLLGLLMGAVVGLWPFREALEPALGDVIGGVELTSPSMVADVEPQDFKTETFRPSLGQLAGSLGLVVLGFLISSIVSRLGGADKSLDR